MTRLPLPLAIVAFATLASAQQPKANGGSLDSAGPTVAGGMLFVNSGYGLYGGQPGNVLIAFGVRR